MRRLNKKGNVSVILSLLVVALFGFTAYAIDIGVVYIEKTKLSNALDSAALAGSLELAKDESKARTVAIEFLQKNNVDIDKTLITISNKRIQIDSQKNVKHFFAPLIGINNSKVKASTKAIIAPVNSVRSGVRPFAVEKFDFSYGSPVVLKAGAGDGYKGNYGAVALGGTGASVFQANALYGYKGIIKVGDYLKTETGNMAGATTAIKKYINSEASSFENFSRDSIRLWTVPLIDSLKVEGADYVQVVGFAVFYIEDVTQNSGKIEVNGRFVKHVLNGIIDMNMSDTGAYGSRLEK